MNPESSFNMGSQTEKSNNDVRAENSLSVISQGPEEAHNSPSTLRIQSGRRLVQEQEEFRFGSELDGDRQSLPVLDTQGTDNGIPVLLQAAHQETLLDVRLLFGHRYFWGLTKNGREEDRLADGRSGLVSVHLLAVPSLGLEIHRQGLAVHEPIASNDADIRALGEDVQ